MEEFKTYYFPPGGSHSIDEKTFVFLTNRLNCGLNEVKARELFYYIDSNATGQMSLNEFLLTFMPD